MTTIKTYQRPTSLEAFLATAGAGQATILAGGTDLQPRWVKGAIERPTAILDIKKIEALHGVQRDGDLIRVGACTVMNELAADPVILAAAPTLAQAAGRIACPQVRNRATLGGNLCNASPAADTAVALILHDAVLELARPVSEGDDQRHVVITDFFKGPGVTCLAPGEMLTYVRFGPVPDGGFSAWNKFGTRPAMEIAVATVAVLLDFDDGVVTHARVAYGSVAPTPLRGHAAEAALVGHRLTDNVIDECVGAARGEVSPITDVRASADYRRRIVGVMLGRMLKDAGSA